MFKYSINLEWSEEDACYIATVAEFPGLSAHGDTPEEAAAEVQEAAEGFLEVYQEDGCPIPEPETHKPFSGQTRLRLPKSLHAALSRNAKKEGVSLNSYIVSLLAERNIARKIERDISEIAHLTRAALLPQRHGRVGASTNPQSWNIVGSEPDHDNVIQYPKVKIN